MLGKPDRLGYVKLLEWLSALQRQWVAGRLRVMVTLRAQGPKIASEYAQRSAWRFNASQADFERYLMHRVQAPDLDYGTLARGLVDVVGQPNAHLSFLEEIATTTFWDNIAGFCGLVGAPEMMPPSVATNRKSTGEQTWRLRDPAEEMAAKDWVGTLLTWIWPSSILPRLRAPARRSLLPIYSATRGLVKRLEMRREESITLTDLRKAAVADAFQDSNAALAETIERDLVALGYTSNDPARND
ncbi:UNVERIFIED_CONTAM: hypothetical protein K0B97_00050 [Spiribacter pallidus]